MSFPSATVSGDLAFLNSGAIMISLRPTVAILSFGTSIPTALLPGIGASILIPPFAASVRAMSSEWATSFLTLIPTGISSSKRVTAGPIVIAITFAGTLKVSRAYSS